MIGKQMLKNYIARAKVLTEIDKATIEVLQKIQKEIIRDIDACERTKSTPYDVGISTGLNMALNKVIKHIKEFE